MWRQSEDIKHSRATHRTRRGESKRDGGGPGKGQEGISCIVHLQRLHTAKHIFERQVNIWNKKEVENEKETLHMSRKMDER